MNKAVKKQEILILNASLTISSIGNNIFFLLQIMYYLT